MGHEGGGRDESGPPKHFKSRIKTRETDDSNRSQTSRVKNPQQRAATALKFNKFLDDGTRSRSQGSVQSFEPIGVPRGIGFAPTHLPKRGITEHSSDADHAVLTWRHKRSSRTPSRCARPPFPSFPLPIPSQAC